MSLLESQLRSLIRQHGITRVRETVEELDGEMLPDPNAPRIPMHVEDQIRERAYRCDRSDLPDPFDGAGGDGPVF